MLLLVACKKQGVNSQNQGGSVLDDNEKQMPEWNKSKTASLYFFTKLKDASLGMDEVVYRAIAERLEDTAGFSVVILDRSDVKLKHSLNGTVWLAEKTNTFPIYNFHKCQEDVMQGAGILIKETIMENRTLSISENCSVKLFKTVVPPNIEWPMANARFENIGQVENLETILTNIISQNRVMIGTIPTVHLGLLRQKILALNRTYRVENIASSSQYALFYISPKYWVLRNIEQASINGDIKLFKLSIEANVFY